MVWAAAPLCLSVFLPLMMASCVGSQPSATVHLPLVADGSTVSPFTTDLGFEVTLDHVRMALAEIQFTQGGEQHTSLFEDLRDLMLKTACAHPGHYAGGEVTGELVGPVVVEWIPDTYINTGEGILVCGEYHGANLLFIRANGQFGLAGDDPLTGHHIHLEGSVSRGGEVTGFEAVMDMPDGASAIGMIMSLDIDEYTAVTLALRLLPTSSQGATLFDGIDFSVLDSNGDGEVMIEPGHEEHNRIQRAFLKHDFYEVKTIE